MQSFDFSRQTIELSRRAYRILASEDRAKLGKSLTYGELSKILGMSHHRPLRFVLHKIQDECRALGKPIITVLVVSKSKGYPGDGCDTHKQDEFEQALQDVSDSPWPTEPWW